MIQNPNPLIIPATEEKIFDQLWVSSISISAPSPDETRVTVELLPRVSQTGELASGQHVVTLSTNKIGKAAAEVPQIKQAFNSILAAVPALKVWLESQGEAGE